MPREVSLTAEGGDGTTSSGVPHLTVTKVTAIPLLAPTDRPWNTGVASFAAYYTVLVRVETDVGVIGYGECLARYQPRVWSALVNDVLAPIVVGSDPFDVEHTWERMYRSFGSFSGHSRGVLLEAMSGVDIALWDIMGKALGQPIARLLGGTIRSLAAYASPVTVADNSAMAAKASGFAERGFQSLKVKVGRPASVERQVLAAIRDAVGDSVQILVDATGAYRFDEAVRMAEVLEDFDVGWFEEPVRPEYRSSYAKLRAQANVPLAAGEGEFTRWGMYELLQTEAIDIIQPDVCRSGGITETRKLWPLATLFHAHYAPHVGGCGAICAAASAHLAAAAPNFLTFECGMGENPLRDHLAYNPVGHRNDMVNGMFTLPDRPGLGLEIDESVVERYRIDA